MDSRTDDEIASAAEQYELSRYSVKQLLPIVRKGIEMRMKQKVYFRERTREALVASKQAEAEFDKMAKEALGE